MPAHEKPQYERRAKAQRHQPAAVAAAAKGDHQQRKHRRERHGARAACMAQPPAQHKRQRDQRVDKRVADTAVEPEERLAHVGQELHGQKQRAAAKADRVCPAKPAQPVEQRVVKRAKARKKCRKQEKAADKVILLPKNARLHVAEYRAKVRALPATAHILRAFDRLLKHRAHAARVAPYVVHVLGKVVVVIIRMIVQGYGV